MESTLSREGAAVLRCEMKERPGVVIGGGAGAERKVEGLLAAPASVTVISPMLTPCLAGWAREGQIHHVKREYRIGGLTGAPLAFVATDDGLVNEPVARDGRIAGVWVSATADPAHCDFILGEVAALGTRVRWFVPLAAVDEANLAFSGSR